MLATYALSFVAGTLSTLSPCVLPLIPILLGTALNTHARAPWFLAGGLALSFTMVGVTLASLGSVLGLDAHLLRAIAAMLLLLFGFILLFSALQERFAVAASRLSGVGQSLLSHVSTDSLSGQFVLGLILGLVWSPCVGPTLGATITLASQGGNLAHTALVMALFGLGAGLPLVLLGMLSRQTMQRYKNRLLGAGVFGKKILGALLILVGLMILTGADKALETIIVSHAPDWLVDFTTRF